MGWFDEQLRERKKLDEEVFEKSFEEAANSVLGARFSFEGEVADDAIMQILRYYRLSFVNIPEQMTESDERLEFVCHSTGLMQKKVKLTPEWYKDAVGAFLVKEKDTGTIRALIPKGIQSYFYYDSDGKKVKINAKTADIFEEEAVCFFKPFPSRKLSVLDLFKFIVANWSISDMTATLGMLLMATLIGTLTPKLSYFLFSDVVEQKSYSLLLSTTVFLILATLCALLFTLVKNYFVSKIGSKMSAEIEAATFMRILSLPTDFFKKYSSGEIYRRMNYISTVGLSVESIVFSAGITGIFSLLYVTQIIEYAPSLAVPALCIILVTILYSIFATQYQMKISKKIMELNARNSGIALSMIDGVQKIKLSGAEKRMFARWAKSFSEETRISYNPPLLVKLNTTISLAISLIGQFIIYFLALQSNIGVAEYYAFNTAYAMVFTAISSLASICTTIAQIKPSLELAKPIIEIEPEQEGVLQPVITLKGSIEMNKVFFRYNENMPYIINDLTVKIRPGQYVAIVGKTGCGKSTLIRLLLGFETPQKGAIYFDGNDLSAIDKKSLRRKIGTVMQDDKLFMGSIFKNITICSPKSTIDDAWEAAEISGIADDIRKMPMGMHTLISEGSGGISGGQKQRLMIARAVAPKPRVLIFDEATSALDNITQKKVSDALDSLKCTRIVIAHRLSTIRHCDRILFLEKGQIVEDGTYDELIAKNGFFAELVERQRLDTAN